METVSLTSCKTIDSFSEYGKSLNISHSKMHFKSLINEKNSSLIMNSSSVLDRYMDYILKYCRAYTMTDIEYVRYRYQPKLFCYDTYGTTELWSLLLKINNWVSVSEFNSKTLKVFNSDINTVLNEIFILESENIEKNNINVGY